MVLVSLLFSNRDIAQHDKVSLLVLESDPLLRLQTRSHSSSVSSSELFEGLEDEIEQGEGKTDSRFDWGAFREARLQQLAEEVERKKTIDSQGGTDGWYGSYREIKEERELIQRSS